MTRLFLALPVENEVVPLIRPVADFLSRFGQALKPVAMNNLHITLKFFGECDGVLARAVEEAFPEIALPGAEVPFTVAGLGAFPDVKRATVLWTGLKAEGNGIERLYRDVEKLYARLGLREEKRDFVPHLTVARVRRGMKLTDDLVRYIEKNGATVYGESSFRRIVLFSSKLTPRGPVYTPVKEARFV
jgi:2'-5' RNA ligase